VADSPIPTPFIDQLTAQGVHLTQHYVHSVCSPTRAALLTGRYHVNTGMTNVLIPGTPAGNLLNSSFSCSCDSLFSKHRPLCDLTGLPSDIPTLPSLLSCLGGYSTAMAGKWHLGHAQHKMTPIGRGFDQFTGLLDSHGSHSKDLILSSTLFLIPLQGCTCGILTATPNSGMKYRGRLH